MTTMPMPMPDTVWSVVKSPTNGPLLAAAAQLYINDDDRVLDVTYGKGNFWTEFRPLDFTYHDLALDGIDCRALPYDAESFDVAVFDPPYIPAAGYESSTLPQFTERFGLAPMTNQELRELMADGIKECQRVLRRKGRLFVKCMDFISSGRFQPVRQFVTNTAVNSGWRQLDELVHFSGPGPSNHKRQIHARRVHSYLCIFERWK